METEQYVPIVQAGAEGLVVYQETYDREVYDAMRAAGIGVQVHYLPIYRHPLFAPFGIAPSDLPETERAYSGLLSLPMFPALTDTQQQRVVETLTTALG